MREGPPAGSGDTMNGAVYISFFQGQLESVLEQVVQLAVQEISKTVGSSLNTLLLETAVKEQENRRLRHQLQAGENRSRAGGRPTEGGGSASGRKAGDELANLEQRLQPPQQHAPGGQGGQARVPTDTRRLQQRGRIVDQLRAVMEHVLSFAVRELTNIVEASFDDLLLEITKMETEQQVLEERLGKTPSRGGRGGGGGWRRGSENDSVSPSGSEDARVDPPEVTSTKEEVGREDPERLPVLSMSQDWTPVLDKVFGQKWCKDIRDQDARGSGERGLDEGGHQRVQPLSAPPMTLEPAPSSPQQDPRWTPLEDMEVFSPDDGATETRRRTGAPASDEGAGSSGRRSSASMLHRLLTLPSQLMEDDDQAAVVRENQVAPKRRRRVWSECGDCGQRFSRKSLLKAHRQTHAAEASGSSPPHARPPSALRYFPCGKRTACKATTGPGSEASRAQRGWTCRIRPDQNQNP
ncbi:uncharacterized protein isoform X3 [Takifugu rubripes]|uniref:uncharacterized protein isoform X3 n=1 Tax=Takifugu rubripes TaxID=31033 RepID=UPI0011453D70|nr:uncharacterized protein LOC115246475 isoform X3 [Takifugu rubripes]